MRGTKKAKEKGRKISQVPPSPLFKYEWALTVKVKPVYVFAQGVCCGIPPVLSSQGCLLVELKLCQVRGKKGNY